MLQEKGIEWHQMASKGIVDIFRCCIFAEEKLHLGITLKQAWRFCSRFAFSLHCERENLTLQSPVEDVSRISAQLDYTNGFDASRLIENNKPKKIIF